MFYQSGSCPCYKLNQFQTYPPQENLHHSSLFTFTIVSISTHFTQDVFFYYPLEPRNRLGYVFPSKIYSRAVSAHQVTFELPMLGLQGTRTANQQFYPHKLNSIPFQYTQIPCPWICEQYHS